MAILPYIEQKELYKAYNFDEPWDGPNNRKLIDKMPAIYSLSRHRRDAVEPEQHLVLRLDRRHHRRR